MTGVPFHYWSRTPEGCRELLEQSGLRLIDTFQDSRTQDTYYIAEKM
jgi:hypothetical protein